MKTKRNRRREEILSSKIFLSKTETYGFDFSEEELAKISTCHCIGRKVFCFDVLESTQDFCKDLIVDKPDAYHGDTVVIADEVLNARGRFMRKWHAPSGGLWFSGIIACPFSFLDLYTLSLGIAVAEGLNSIGIESRSRWPNDVYVNEKKIAGSLIEVYGSYWIFGIGVNVNNDPPVPNAVSLKRLTGKETDVDELYFETVKRINFFFGLVDWYLTRKAQAEDDGTMIKNPVTERFLTLTDLLNREIRYKPGLASHVATSGIVRGIDERGFLQVEREEGIVVLRGEEIILV